jgi:transketolase
MATTKFILGMRDAFFESLYPYFQKDKNAIFITADNGAPSLDQFSETLPNQFFTVGIAEQQMIGMASGMAYESKKVYTYAIAPFITLRIYEQIKVDVCSMNLPIVSIGVGAGYAYDIMGPTHHTVEDISIMRTLPNMTLYSPADSISAAALAKISYENPGPQYIRFDRAGVPEIYADRKDINFKNGIIHTKKGMDVYLIATGIMVHQALEVTEKLEEMGISAGIIDLMCLKPINKDLLFQYLGGVQRVVTMEEHLLAGGMGSAIAEIFVDEGISMPMLRIGQNDRFVFDMGGREAIWENYGLDVNSMTEKISRWMERRKPGQARVAVQVPKSKVKVVS